MFNWSHILQPLPTALTSDATIQDALKEITKSSEALLLITKDGEVDGYIDQSFLLEQIQAFPCLREPVQYKQDLLKVPLQKEIEFYHHISVYIGVNERDELAGYCTTEHARQRIHELRLAELNQLSTGAGIGIITTNLSFSITFVNEMAEKILGLSSSFLLNRNYNSLIEVEYNLHDVLAGNSVDSVSSYLNFKHMIGNFTPLTADGQVTGLVHIFFLREQWEEAVRGLEFVRHLNEDLQAIYSSSHEQIMAVSPQGSIMRLTGTFLKDYWRMESPEEVIGQSVFDLEKQGLFQPNIVEMCMEKGTKLSCVQESQHGSRVWSVATPVFYEGQLTKVITISRDITEVDQLKKKLSEMRQESEEYKEELEKLKKKNLQKSHLIYQSPEMEQVADEIRTVAEVATTVLINGESGVGKEVVAAAIHEWSDRRPYQFIGVNCGAIPEQLLESELFGYEKGAFTGADVKGKPGYFELANHGTIFLDEISELPLNMQVKLLRVLQEREITRIGGTKKIPLNVRVVAATNRDLWELVQSEKFREDLYYRLNIIPIHIPPLRKRKEDIMPLSLHFLQQFNDMYGKEKFLTEEALEVLENHQWQGNVRELQNVIERLCVTSRKEVISHEDILSILYARKPRQKEPIVTLELMPLKQAVAEVERQLLTLGLKKYGTAAKVAEVLEVSPATISRRIKKLLN